MWKMAMVKRDEIPDAVPMFVRASVDGTADFRRFIELEVEAAMLRYSHPEGGRVVHVSDVKSRRPAEADATPAFEEDGGGDHA